MQMNVTYNQVMPYTTRMTQKNSISVAEALEKV